MVRRITLAVLIVSLIHSSVSAKGYCPNTILFTKNSYDLESSETQTYEENYDPDSKNYDDFCLPKGAMDEDLNFVKELSPLFKDRIDSKKNKIQQDVYLLIASFISMILLAKNGYEMALSKELFYFTSQLLKINSALTADRKIPEIDKKIIIEKIFEYLSRINQKHFMDLTSSEKQRSLQFMEQLSHEVLKDNYSAEYKSVLKNHINKDTMNFASLVLITTIGLAP